MREDMDKMALDDKTHTIPFTARLMAHYRARELELEHPLLIDPYAERLAGDLTTYFRNHGRYFQMDYGIVRSHYIEEELLRSWCRQKDKSQIVLLGAGLDTKAFRFEPLKKNKHHLFEIDLPSINNYKNDLLKDEKPFCPLTRISGDFNALNWIDKLFESGFQKKIPTFWIMEGLVYYLRKVKVSTLLKKINDFSAHKSKIFTDLCIPIYAEIQVGPFSKHFKWGLEKDKIYEFFAQTGWDVEWDWADNYDQGRDVGQKGLYFIVGVKKR
ncbi:MAG: SAM-dependent methyltransferase [Candidatus Lokiarchaeota archaeon]|nr:SAM-dependent methyltransferase [Candidatus Lokiarchaeota archaeon]